jgi:hypothetical protein
MNQTESSAADQEMTREAWESIATEPDAETDLGYQLTEWEQFETLDDTDQLIFLPDSETQLKDAAFVVADTETVVNLEDRC